MSVIVVAHDSLSALKHTLPAVIGQFGHDDELIVVDSGSTDDIVRQLSDVAPNARLISGSGNVGFAAGVNLGAAAATGELLVLLNPDATVQPGWAAAMRAGWGGVWSAWMALVMMDGGDTINTSGGVLHFCGIGWSGQAGQSLTEAPREPCRVPFLSGACMAIPATEWERLGGFSTSYFMYCEDVDLSLRVRLGGGSIGVIPAARVIHDYEFDKGPAKWRLLERNRWATLIRCYPSPVLVMVAPALVAAELAVWLAAVRGGWSRMKALSVVDLVRALPRLIVERREIQASRTIDARAFAEALSGELHSPYLGSGARRLEFASRAYWAAVCRLLALT